MSGRPASRSGSGPAAPSPRCGPGRGGSSAHVIVDVTGYYVPGSTGSTFVPLTPTRVLDTRTGAGLSGTFASGIPRTLAVAGSGGVPSGATAITGNLVAVNPGSNGYLSIGSSVSSTPATSSLNVLRGDTRSARRDREARRQRPARRRLEGLGRRPDRRHPRRDRLLRRDAAGRRTTRSTRPACSTAASRTGCPGPFATKVARTLQATGRGTVPVNAVAVTGGATVVLPTGAGWLTVGPSGSLDRRDLDDQPAEGRHPGQRRHDPGRLGRRRVDHVHGAVGFVGERDPRRHGLLPLTPTGTIGLIGRARPGATLARP